MDDPKSVDINYGALLGPLSIVVGVVFLLICIAGWVCRCWTNFRSRNYNTDYNEWLRNRNNNEGMQQNAQNNGQTRERWSSFSNLFLPRSQRNTRTHDGEQYHHNFGGTPTTYPSYQNPLPDNDNRQQVTNPPREQPHTVPTSTLQPEGPPAYSAVVGYQNYLSPGQDGDNTNFYPSAPPRYETITANSRE